MVVTEKVENVSAVQVIRPIRSIENYIYKKDQQTKGHTRKHDDQDMTFKETLEHVREREKEVHNNVQTHMNTPFVYYDSNARARLFHNDKTFTEKG